MPRRPIWITLAIAVSLVAACSNASDPRFHEAAESLVPAGSEVTDVIENTTSLSIETGPYFVVYEITDGGLGRDLVEAIDERAEAAGWAATGRSRQADGIELRFTREDLDARVRVGINRDPVSASIHVTGDE